MNQFIEFISQPWPWYVAGPIIAVVMFSLLLFGNTFGISSNLRTMCSILGAGKNCEYFDFKWKNQIWNLVFAAGLVLGGIISQNFLTPSDGVIGISSETTKQLASYGISTLSNEIAPSSIFNWESLATVKGFVMLVIGGFFVGFGTRYAGGCTSGHAITGLSDLQKSSLIAVIGFFIGGLFVTHFVLPYLLAL